MRLRILSIAVLLMLGAATSVGVAWGSVLLRDSAVLTSNAVHKPGPEWAGFTPYGFTERREVPGLTIRVFEGIWPEDEAMTQPIAFDLPGWSFGRIGPAFDHRVDAYGVEVESGWPLRCLRTSWRVDDLNAAVPGEFLRGGFLAMPIVLPGQAPTGVAVPNEHVALPFLPIWGGLAINTLVFASAWCCAWMALCMAVRAWEWWRVARDRCVRCGYPLGSAPVCAECGVGGSEAPRLIGPRRVGVLALVCLGVVLGVVFAGWYRASVAYRLPPMHAAAAEGDADLLRRLIASGAPSDAMHMIPTTRYHSGYPFTHAPLAFAAGRGHPEAVRVLLDGGADPDANTGSALLLAASEGHADVCRVLLDRGASPVLRDSGRTSELRVAAFRSNDRETILLIEAVLAPFKSDPWALFEVPPYGVEAMRFALGLGDWDPYAIVVAAESAIEHRRPEVLALLIDEAGLDPAEEGEWLLAEACWHCDRESLRLLLEHGADHSPESYDIDAPLTVAAEHGCVACLELLIDAGAGEDEDALAEALTAASREGALASIGFFLRVGVHVDTRLEDGLTMLMVASQRKRTEMVRLLLASGADPTLRDDAAGKTALDFASARHFPSGTDAGSGIQQEPATVDFRLLEMLEEAESRRPVPSTRPGRGQQ